MGVGQDGEELQHALYHLYTSILAADEDELEYNLTNLSNSVYQSRAISDSCILRAWLSPSFLNCILRLGLVCNQTSPCVFLGDVSVHLLSMTFVTASTGKGSRYPPSGRLSDPEYSRTSIFVAASCVQRSVVSDRKRPKPQAIVNICISSYINYYYVTTVLTTIAYAAPITTALKFLVQFLFGDVLTA